MQEHSVPFHFCVKIVQCNLTEVFSVERKHFVFFSQTQIMASCMLMIVQSKEMAVYLLVFNNCGHGGQTCAANNRIMTQ